MSKVIATITTPQLTTNDQIVAVVKLHCAQGAAVKSGDALLDVHTSKSVETVYAGHEGYVHYLCKVGDDIATGQPIVTIYESSDFLNQLAAAPLVPASKSAPAMAGQAPQISKPALMLMQDNGIDPSVFAGADFVTRADVERHLQGKDLDHIEVVKLSAAKRTEIRYLSQGQAGALNSLVHIYVDMNQMLDYTRAHFSVLKFSILPLIIYETARLLKEYKDLNAYYMGEDRVGYYREVMIGLAMDIDDGLKVINLPLADQQSPQGIETLVNEMAGKYKQGALKAQDLEGSTFTITDLSFQGVNFFTPLINKNQAAILGVSAIDFKLNRCILSLAFDHRVSEGKRAGQFLSALKKKLEAYQGPEGKLGPQCFKCSKPLQAGGLGLFKMLDAKGREKLICATCVKEWV